MENIFLEFNRIFLLSDIHMGVRSNSLEWLDNQVDYFRNFLIPLIKENKQEGDILFILGDVFDNRQSIDILVSNTTQDIIAEIADIIPIHILCGNHDMYKKMDNVVNSLRTFKYFNNVHVYTEKTLLTNSHNQSIFVLPYSEEYQVDEDIITNSKCDYLFAHADILGMKLDNGSDVKKGLNLSKSSIKRVFSGHIHKRQEKGKIVYIGSPYHTKRSDIGDTKGVYLFNAVDNEYQFFFNDHSPIYKRLSLTQLLDMELGEIKELLHNNYTDIIVPLDYVSKFNISQFIDYVEGCGYKRIESMSEKKKDSTQTTLSSDDVSNLTIKELLENAIDKLTQDESIRTYLKEYNNKYYNAANIDE